MSLPNERHPGAVYFVTRRTERRSFRLKPVPELRNAFGIALADAAARRGVRPVIVWVGSDHWHGVFEDPRGELSEFLCDVHGLVARFCNAAEDVTGAVWDGQQTDVQELADAEVLVAKCGYVAAQAVKHRLCASPTAWCGLWTRVEDMGTGRGPHVVRPARWFRADGPVSEEATLQTHVPPMAARAFGAEGFRRRVQAELARRVAAVHAEAAADGKGFVGMARVLAASVWDEPKTPDGRKSGKRARPRKRAAAACREVLVGVLERMNTFRRRHREALAAMRAGLREVVFPAGTLRAWRVFGCPREPYELTYEAPA